MSNIEDLNEEMSTCGRCHRELHYMEVCSMIIMLKDYDLCDDCRAELKEWLLPLKVKS